MIQHSMTEDELLPTLGKYSATKLVGLVVNPVAGMGGAVGLKGTDGVYQKAVSLGAEQVSPLRAEETLKEFFLNYSNNDILWYTCSNEMGENLFKK